MKEILIAENAGYCFGVKRAMNIAWEELNKKDETSSLYAYGPLIHNKQAVGKYEERGLITVESLDEVADNSRVIIRSHGVSKSVYDISKSMGLEVVDTTCPFVKKIHYIVSKASEEGKNVILFGNISHPEVEGISGWCKGSAVVVGSFEELRSKRFDIDKKYVLVSQTTMNLSEFEKIEEYLRSVGLDVEVENTICSATKLRQNSAKELAQKVDIMVVIGGRHSSNTQKLVKICSEIIPTISVETSSELNKDDFSKYKIIGVTAGASTPDWIIDEVVKFLRGLE